jgi:hypothetical protein
MNLGVTPLCDRCYDVRVAETTGWSRLPEPPPPESIAGPDGRVHRIEYRIWRSPGGVAINAEEDGDPFAGYCVEVVGAHDADPAILVDRARAAIRRRIGRQDLTHGPGGPHWIMSDFDLRGRLVWNEQGGPYDVVVDGRPLTWEEFGLALEPFEGWEFRLSFRSEDVDADDARIAGDAAGQNLPPASPMDARVH